MYADAITTVSPTYAREILTPEYGCGFDELLRERAPQLVGILNGVDYDVWDPSCDPFLAGHYTAGQPGPKAINKQAIQFELGLDVTPDQPLLAYVSRLDYQKAPDLVLEALPTLIEEGKSNLAKRHASSTGKGLDPLDKINLKVCRGC